MSLLKEYKARAAKRAAAASTAVVKLAGKKQVKISWSKTPEAKWQKRETKRIKNAKAKRADTLADRRRSIYLSKKKDEKALMPSRRYLGKNKKYAKEAKAKNTKSVEARKQAKRDIEKLAGVKFTKPIV